MSGGWQVVRSATGVRTHRVKLICILYFWTVPEFLAGTQAILNLRTCQRNGFFESYLGKSCRLELLYRVPTK